MNGEKFIQCPDTRSDADLKLFSDSLKACPRSGLHNPLKNPERYAQYGDLSFKLAEVMRKKEVEDFFVDLMQRYSLLTPESSPRVMSRPEESSS